MYEVANTTHLIIDGLMQGSIYSFTVQAVDYGGRVGDTSEAVTLLLDGKVFIIVIISITLFNSSRGNTKFDIFCVYCDGSIFSNCELECKLIIRMKYLSQSIHNNFCLQEIDSTKPPVTHYNIYHNILSSAITESLDTSVTFHNVSCDTLYVIIVNAENIIGEGGNKSISICELIFIIKSLNNYYSFSFQIYIVLLQLHLSHLVLLLMQSCQLMTLEVI